MTKSAVYFFDDAPKMALGVDKFLGIISRRLGEGKTALKIHFGEEKNTTHIKPEWLHCVKKHIPDATLVDCNVLYRGSRTRKKDHIKTAIEHGFNFMNIDILDGELGEASTEVEVNTKNTKTAKLGAGIVKYKNIVALSHFKGHISTGFGGAIKNMGMGLGSRAGKLEMHAIVSPYVKAEKCVACGVCVRDCPADAITLEGKANINPSKCIGCAHCIAVCPQGAINVPWDLSESVNNKLMENVADYALAATGGRRCWYINFLANITLECDCLAMEQKPFMEDVGVLFSEDPVAIDQASLDLIVERNNGVDPFMAHNKVKSTHILKYGEHVKLGSRDYDLVKVH